MYYKRIVYGVINKIRSFEWLFEIIDNFDFFIASRITAQFTLRSSKVNKLVTLSCLIPKEISHLRPLAQQSTLTQYNELQPFLPKIT